MEFLEVQGKTPVIFQGQILSSEKVVAIKSEKVGFSAMFLPYQPVFFLCH